MDTVETEKPKGPYEIHKAVVRAGLAPSPVPYWAAQLAPGQYIGFRKIDAQRGSWIARVWLPEAINRKGKRGKQKFKALGFVTPEFDYKAATAAAREFFDAQASGKGEDKRTVADACRAYLAKLEAGKRGPAAQDAKKRFERTVYGNDNYLPHSIAATKLADLEASELDAWRNGLELSISSKNRTLTALKAALNLAVKFTKPLQTKRLEWSVVTAEENPEDTRREIYLDLKQRRALLNAATGPVRDLLEAATLTGARAGELVNATRRQFDARKRTLKLIGKTGSRTITLTAAALELFTRLAKGKKPGDRLLTSDGKGKAWGHSGWDKLVKDAAKAAKLPTGTCLYTLRHSWISQMIEDGMTTLDVSKLAGTSLLMLDKHYGKASKDVEARLNSVVML